MPISKDFALPGSAKHLDMPQSADAKMLVLFISSEDAETRQPWCPDVREAWPQITAVFGGEEAPRLSVVEVGQRPEWRDPNNVYRKNWSVNSIPTLAKYQRVNGEVTETARLDGHGILDQEELRRFRS